MSDERDAGIGALFAEMRATIERIDARLAMMERVRNEQLAAFEKLASGEGDYAGAHRGGA
jgi:hypothetical protein